MVYTANTIKYTLMLAAYCLVMTSSYAVVAAEMGTDTGLLTEEVRKAGEDIFNKDSWLIDGETILPPDKGLFLIKKFTKDEVRLAVIDKFFKLQAGLHIEESFTASDLLLLKDSITDVQEINQQRVEASMKNSINQILDSSLQFRIVNQVSYAVIVLPLTASIIEFGVDLNVALAGLVGSFMFYKIQNKMKDHKKSIYDSSREKLIAEFNHTWANVDEFKDKLDRITKSQNSCRQMFK